MKYICAHLVRCRLTYDVRNPIMCSVCFCTGGIVAKRKTNEIFATWKFPMSSHRPTGKNDKFSGNGALTQLKSVSCARSTDPRCTRNYFDFGRNFNNKYFQMRFHNAGGWRWVLTLVRDLDGCSASSKWGK